jgi:hypothetical protein
LLIVSGYRLIGSSRLIIDNIPGIPTVFRQVRDGGVPADLAVSRHIGRSAAAGGLVVALVSRARWEPRPVAFERAGLRGLLAFIAVSLILWALIIYGLLWAFR